MGLCNSDAREIFLLNPLKLFNKMLQPDLKKKDQQAVICQTPLSFSITVLLTGGWWPSGTKRRPRASLLVFFELVQRINIFFLIGI